MKLGVAVALAVMLLFGARSAQATLSSSEKGQIRDFYNTAQAQNGSRVRALVARTDLTAEESISALAEAVTPVPFTDERGIFLREMAFGVSSASMRPLLAQALVRALLGRAESVFQKYVGGLDHEPHAITELVAIYAFLDGTIANAGRPTLAAHDPSAGVSAAAYEDCSKAMRDHVEKNSRWLKGDGLVAEPLGRVRAQAQIALLDMLPDGLTRRVDAADRLGLKGARRLILTEWGILLQDGGKLDDAKATQVHKALARLPGARVDLEVVYAGDDHGPLRARGIVGFVGGRAPAEPNPFGEELTPTSIDTATSTVVHDLAVMAVRRALDNRGDLLVRAEHDASAVHADPSRMLGKARAPSIDHVVGAAAHLLVLDAPRAIDLAFVRFIAGRPESTAILSDAIGALAAFAVTSGAPAPGGPSQGLSLELGKGNGSTTMTAIRLARDGSAHGFTLDGHVWSIDRAAKTGAVTGVTRDGDPVSLAHLTTAKTPLRDASIWSDAGLTFTKLRGTPRAGIAPPPDKNGAPRVLLSGSGPKGYDAIVMPPPGEDFVLEGELSVSGAPGGLAFRSVDGREAVRGALLVIHPGGRAELVTSDDVGTEALLAAPIDPAPSMPVHVKISVKGLKVEAVVGPTTLNGTLPPTLSKGEVGLVAKRGGNVDFGGFSLKKK
jgi:hypothetical protein